MGEEDKNKLERIANKVLDQLDKMKFVNRKKSYSHRIKLLFEYCNRDKKEFNKWLKSKEER